MITVRIEFDGGYLYDFSHAKQQVVYVDQVSADHPLKFVVEDGSGNSPVQVQGILAVWPDGKPPAPDMPGLPPVTADMGCDKTETANQRRFIPDLDKVARMTGKGSVKGRAERNPSASIQLTGYGSALSVASIGGCVEYRQHGQSVGGTRSMASGVRGIVFEWPVDAQSVALVQTLNGATTILSQAWPDADGTVSIVVSTFEAIPDPDSTPHEIDHFWNHFKDVFKDIDPGNPVALWWLGSYSVAECMTTGAKRSDVKLLSPGIDCPPGSTG